MTKRYIVVRNDETVCCNGPKPFLGDMAQAKDLANFLKSVNQKDEYEVFSVTKLTVKGSVVAKYSSK